MLSHSNVANDQKSLRRGLLRLLLSITLTLNLNNSAVAAELSDLDNKNYAKACFDVVKRQSTCTLPGESIFAGLMDDERRSYKSTYSYWPSQILEINSNGAVIKTRVEVTFECNYGDNDGWGSSKIKEHSETFTCLSGNVAKGTFPQPTAFIKESGISPFWCS